MNTKAILTLLLETILMCGNISGQSIGQDSGTSITLRDRLAAKLAVGGLVQGLLTIQIRPQPGFYEEKYKDIFPDVEKPNTTSNLSDKKLHPWPNTRPSVSTASIRLSEDGRLLKSTSMGLVDTPCFDIERVIKNRLLALLCSMRLQKELLQKNFTNLPQDSSHM